MSKATRELNGFELVPAAIEQDAKGCWRPGVSVYRGDVSLSIFQVGYPDDFEMSEDEAHEAAWAVLEDVLAVGHDGASIRFRDSALVVLRVDEGVS